MELPVLDDAIDMMDPQPALLLEEDLPVAMPLAVDDALMGQDGDDENIVDAHLLHRHGDVHQRGTSFLYGMVQDQDNTCSSVLGWGARSCRRIVERIQEHNDDVYYTDPRTGRTPLHEACLRCSCNHVISAILSVNSARATATDLAGNTPLHLLCIGVSTHALDPREMGDILDRLLAENSSIAASICNREGNSALHMACMAPETMLPLASFQKLLRANSQATARANTLNQTPFNLHCQRRQASKAVAKLLIDSFPDAIQMVDGAKGWSPLHYAADGKNYELIKLILQNNPAATSLRTSTQMETPLHLLCKKNVSQRHLPALQCLLNSEPRTSMARDANKSFTPLHLVCRNAAVPLGIVKAIVEACPQAASVPDSNNYLPIHHACEVGTATKVIEHLLQVHGDGATATTKKKDTALSLACASNKSAATVALLIRANPGALTESNHYGFVPLHCNLASINPKIGIVEEILKVCPKSASIKSHGGESAIHIASGNPGTCVGVIELLTTQYEKDTGGTAQLAEARNPQHLNKVGNTPLHHSCFRGSPFEHIETLAMSNPHWVKCANNAGYTALQILCKNARLQDRVITTFSRIGGPGVFSVTDLMGNTPLHSAMREETDIEALRCLIRAYPDALNMKTTYGDTPLHLACFRRVDAEVVREVALSSSEPPLLTPNTAGQTPIGIAMEEFEAMCIRGCSCCVKADYRPEQQRAFDVLATLVKILHYGSEEPNDDRDRTGSLLRACVSLHRRDVRLDPAFIRRALHLYPEEARILDEDGNYPLHIEASIPVEKMSLLNSTAEASCSGNCHQRLGILRMLYEIFPDACKARNNAGEFPLGLMIKARGRWDQTFALVLRNFPQALHWSVGVNSKAFPRILEKVSRECGVATLHQLISSRPDIVTKSYRPTKIDV